MMITRALSAVLIVALLAGPAGAISAKERLRALRAEKAGANRKDDKKEKKAPVVEPTSIKEIYTVEKLRDPMMKVAGGFKKKVSDEEEELNFSIHKLSLSAIMKDRRTGYALFTDNETGSAYIFKSGRLYNRNRRRVPGVSGVINIRAKTVNLFWNKATEKFRLGGEDQEE